MDSLRSYGLEGKGRGQPPGEGRARGKEEKAAKGKVGNTHVGVHGLRCVPVNCLFFRVKSYLVAGNGALVGWL